MKKLISNIIRFSAITLVFIIAAVLIIKADFYVSNLKPNIVLITAQSLRPDHLSCYGYEHISTKTIDSLAARGVLFENAYCNVPHSLFANTTILSGKLGGSVLFRRGESIGFNTPYKLLSGYLKNKGYSTIAVASSQFSLKDAGFGKDFDGFENVLKDIKPQEYSSRAEKVTKKALGLLKQFKKSKKPIFLWAEYSLPQYPYALPETFKEDEGDFPYDRQILLLDSEIAKLMKGLRKLGLSKNTIIILTATNGESFDEHKEPLHGIFLYEPGVKVPLIVSLPKGPSKRKTKKVCSQMDIAPTILDILRIPYNTKEFDGESLLAQIKEKKEAKENQKRSVYLETLAGYYDFGWSPVVALVSDGYKYIELPKPELYDLKKDPYEFKNIVYQDTAKATSLKKSLLEYIEKKRPQLLQILNKGADPKDKIELVRPIILGVAFRFDNVDAMLKFYTDLLSKDLDNKRYKLVVAGIYFSQQKLSIAKSYALELVEKDPDFNRAWELLGLIYDIEKDNDKAIESYKKAISIFYDMPVSLNNLAWMYAQKGTNLTEALKYAQRANELVPNMPNFMDTLAEVNLKLGNKEKAVEILKKAVELDPKTEHFKNRLQEIQK